MVNQAKRARFQSLRKSGAWGSVDCNGFSGSFPYQAMGVVPPPPPPASMQAFGGGYQQAWPGWWRRYAAQQKNKKAQPWVHCGTSGCKGWITVARLQKAQPGGLSCQHCNCAFPTSNSGGKQAGGTGGTATAAGGSHALLAALLAELPDSVRPLLEQAVQQAGAPAAGSGGPADEGTQGKATAWKQAADQVRKLGTKKAALSEKLAKLNRQKVELEQELATNDEELRLAAIRETEAKQKYEAVLLQQQAKCAVAPAVPVAPPTKVEAQENGAEAQGQAGSAPGGEPPQDDDSMEVNEQDPDIDEEELEPELREEWGKLDAQKRKALAGHWVRAGKRVKTAQASAQPALTGEQAPQVAAVVAALGTAFAKVVQKNGAGAGSASSSG